MAHALLPDAGQVFGQAALLQGLLEAEGFARRYHVVLIAVPLILQTFLIFFIAYGACRILKLPYDISAPAAMIGASNFFELSVAVAIALFGTTSPAALATTVGVLTEVPVMLTLVRIANSTQDYFPKRKTR